MTVAMSATDRRHSILEAALLCFLEKGYRATSIADIRERSGASTGSIYHFFAGKGALAESLLRQALSGQTAAAPASVADAESHIKASVYGLVLWGLTNPSHLRFMDEVRSLAFHDDELMGVRKLLLDGQAAGAAQFQAMQEVGAVRNLPFALAQALMHGPAYAYLRQAPETETAEAERIAAILAEEAWQSVRA